MVNLKFSKFYRQFRLDFYPRQIAAITVLIDIVTARLCGTRVHTRTVVVAVTLVLGVAVTSGIDR
ncbi:MAG: hypothetical protein WBR24_19670 [Desulfobacterales bacterium]